MSDPIPTNVVLHILGIHDDTLRKYEREGRIHCIKTENGRKFYDSDEVLFMSNSSLKILIQSWPTQWLFDNYDDTKPPQFVFVVPESKADLVPIGNVTCGPSPLNGMQDSDVQVMGITKKDYDVYYPAGIRIILFHKQLENLSSWGGVFCNGTQEAWSYAIPKKHITRVYEERWKFPHLNWDTHWLYACVPDDVLKRKEAK
jgi:hypothetical protein